jgi:hypothetical protein
MTTILSAIVTVDRRCAMTRTVMSVSSRIRPSASRFIQQKNRCAAHQRAGEIEPLALSARQSGTAIAGKRRVFFGQHFDKGCGIRPARSLANFLICRVWLTISNVLGQRDVEDLRRLWSIGDTAPETCQIKTLDIGAINEDLAG